MLTMMNADTTSRSVIRQNPIESAVSVLQILLRSEFDAVDGGLFILTLSNICIAEREASDGDLVRASIMLRTPSNKVISLVFEEELADGMFSVLDSHFWTWRRDEWFEVLGSDRATDVIFEAAKGLIRSMRPDLFGIVSDDWLRKVLEEQGYSVKGRDGASHFHWHIVRDATGVWDFYPSLRAAARQLLD